MLRVGLTGGIGSGKSTVAARLVERGAVLIDSDRLARDVVAPDTPGLAEVAAAFGDGVLAPDGSLDRPSLASIVFGDPAALARLNAIIHPLVRGRSDGLAAAAPADAVVVHDIPLLVEGGMAPLFPLVVVVHADAEERVRRLAGSRGMADADARARIANQADDAARRAAADVWLDNSGAPGNLAAQVDALWTRRLVPFEENLRWRRPASSPAARIVDADPGWAAAGARIAARVAAAAGARGRGVAHIGCTAVPGLPAPDVIGLQLGVGSLDDADALCDALLDAGLPRFADVDRDGPERQHRHADPGRPVHLHIREVGSPGWRDALLIRDWLRADADVRAEYLTRTGNAADGARYAEPEEAWFDAAVPRAEAWAASSGWTPSSAS